MKKIYFFKPFEANYINRTTTIYANIIQSLPNVTLVDINNFKNIFFQDNSIVVYMPITLTGSNIITYNNLMYRLKNIYNTKDVNFLNYNILNEYYSIFLLTLENSFKNICILYELDLHDLIDSKIQNDFLLKYNSVMLLGGHELYDIDIHSNEVVHDVNIEIAKKGLEYLYNYRHNIISLPHVISEDEILSDTSNIFKNNKYELSVPGTKYILRKRALNILKRLYFLTYLKNFYNWFIMKLLYRLPFPSLKHSLLHSHFLKQINQSKYCFTCGSTAGYFVRKFFEIPSFGSIMITYNYSFLKNCGFIPEVHYVPLEQIDDLNKIFKKDKIDARCQNLCNIKYNASALIRQKHSSFARYVQLLNTFKYISMGNFNGSYWIEGEYIIRSND